MDAEHMTLAHVPPTLREYQVPQAVLDQTWEFLRERGREEVEGVVLWLGTVADPEHASVLAAMPPAQIAYRSEEGLSVAIPQDELSALIGALPHGVHVLARVHSHGDEAYHSQLDDTNMVIAHQGAISIVVPGFAAGPVSLLACSVNELLADGSWRELTPHAASALLVIA
jgi:hypothetical protein